MEQQQEGKLDRPNVKKRMSREEFWMIPVLLGGGALMMLLRPWPYASIAVWLLMLLALTGLGISAALRKTLSAGGWLFLCIAVVMWVGIARLVSPLF